MSETIVAAPLAEAPASAPETDIRPVVPVALPPPSLPYVTWALMILLALVFGGELVFAIEPPTSALEPSIRTLTALGGLQYLLVVHQGQWWRVFTAPLLHASLVHILLNGVALWLAGVALERAVGRLWFAAIFVIGALGGACGSLLINPSNLVSIGASGAIMGLFAAMFVLSFHYTHAPDRTNLQRRAMQVLIPSLLPLANAGHAGKVDYGAHAGGAVAGAIAGYLLLRLWRETDVLPALRKVAMAIVALGVLGSAAGASAVGLKYRFWQATTHIIPSEQLPKKDSDIHEDSAEWYVTKYPADPRSHYYRAIFLLRKPDLAAAERELRLALDQHAVMDQLLSPSFKHSVQGLLALVLSDEHRTDEARQSAASACSDSSVPFSAKLKASGLCPTPQ